MELTRYHYSLLFTNNYKQSEREYFFSIYEEKYHLLKKEKTINSVMIAIKELQLYLEKTLFYLQYMDRKN